MPRRWREDIRSLFCETLAWDTDEWAKHVFRGYEVVIFINENKNTHDRPTFKFEARIFSKYFREIR